MTQKTVLTESEIARLQMLSQVMLNDPSGFHRAARAIEQAVLSSATESRAKHFGDGYEAGWNAALEEAAIAIDGNDMTSRHAVKTIRTLKRKQS